MQNEITHSDEPTQNYYHTEQEAFQLLPAHTQHAVLLFWFCCHLCCLHCRSRMSTNKPHLIFIMQPSTNIQLCHFYNARPLQSNFQAFFFCRLLFFFKQSCIAYILILAGFPLPVWLHPLIPSVYLSFFSSAISKACLTALQPHPHYVILWHTTFLVFSVSTPAINNSGPFHTNEHLGALESDVLLRNWKQWLHCINETLSMF